MNKEKIIEYINKKLKEKELIEPNSWANGYTQALEILRELIKAGVFDNE